MRATLHAARGTRISTCDGPVRRQRPLHHICAISAPLQRSTTGCFAGRHHARPRFCLADDPIGRRPPLAAAIAAAAAADAISPPPAATAARPHHLHRRRAYPLYAVAAQSPSPPWPSPTFAVSGAALDIASLAAAGGYTRSPDSHVCVSPCRSPQADRHCLHIALAAAAATALALSAIACHVGRRARRIRRASGQGAFAAPGAASRRHVGSSWALSAARGSRMITCRDCVQGFRVACRLCSMVRCIIIGLYYIGLRYVFNDAAPCSDVRPGCGCRASAAAQLGGSPATQPLKRWQRRTRAAQAVVDMPQRYMQPRHIEQPPLAVLPVAAAPRGHVHLRARLWLRSSRR